MSMLSNNFQLKKKCTYSTRKNISAVKFVKCGVSVATVPNSDPPTSHISYLSDQIENSFHKYKYKYLFRFNFKFVKCGVSVATVPNSDPPTSHILSFSSRSNRKCLSKYIYRFKFQI